MNEKNTMSMEELLKEENYDLDGAMRLPRLHEIVNGTVHQVTDKGIIVDMGCKKDGLIPKEEVTLVGDQKLTDLFEAGDEIQAKVIKTDDGEGVITLSRKKLEANANWNEIVEAYDSKEILNVKVLRQVNGGVIAAYKEVTGFIPLSQLSDKYVENAEEFIGQDIDVRVSRIDTRRNRAVFSHKVIAQEEKQARLEAIWNTLSEGDIVEGKVMRFTDYGAFVDLGGIDGLLHISEISWGKLRHPQEVLKIGDTVKVKILSMNAEKGKISLGLKQCTPEPWSVIYDNYQVGQIVTGKVVQIKDYGAFVELEPGLDGLVHISEVAHKRVNDISEEIKVGETVQAKILEIDTERKRISLSIKQTKEPEEEVPAEVEEAEEIVEEAAADTAEE
jgi:4-hydroxy-3-methylbut-2-enyl diphosphate reductase